MSNVRVIKRYANRKLYDTERSCYVTLEDLATLIREGEEVKIIDNKSAEDLTTVTLAQIVFETEKKAAFMPLSLLRDLIQNSGSALKDFARGGVDAVQQKALDVREQASKLKSEVGERLGAIGGELEGGQKGADSNGTAQQVVSELVTNSKTAFERLQQTFEEKFKGSMSNVARVASLGRDIEDIRQRLNGVEDRIHGLPAEQKGVAPAAPSTSTSSSSTQAPEAEVKAESAAAAPEGETNGVA